jgi:hypothetical protein
LACTSGTCPDNAAACSRGGGVGHADTSRVPLDTVIRGRQIEHTRRGCALAGMFRAFTSIPARHPFAFGVAYTGFKGAAVDLLVQTQAEGTPLTDLDLRRLGLFTLFNASFTGVSSLL